MNPKLTPGSANAREGIWDDYLVSPENASAHGAVQSLLRGESANSPLLILGAPGVGKSELLRRLARDWISRSPSGAIAELTAESFAGACYEAGAARSASAWSEVRDRFRHVELLALDDLQSLLRTPSSVDELGRTLDDLDEAGAAVVLTSRAIPSTRAGWPARIVDRLLGGLITRLEPPSVGTRRRYLLEQSRREGMTIPSEELERLAEAADGFRTLNGWLHRLRFVSKVNRRPLDEESIAQVALVEESLPTSNGAIRAIIHATAHAFGLRPRDLRGKRRNPGIAVPRHLAIALCRELTGASFRSLGRAFGNRDSQTIRHACRVSAARLRSDPSLAATAETIRQEHQIQRPTT